MLNAGVAFRAPYTYIFFFRIMVQERIRTNNYKSNDISIVPQHQCRNANRCFDIALGTIEVHGQIVLSVSRSVGVTIAQRQCAYSQ